MSWQNLCFMFNVYSLFSGLENSSLPPNHSQADTTDPASTMSSKPALSISTITPAGLTTGWPCLCRIYHSVLGIICSCFYSVYFEIALINAPAGSLILLRFQLFQFMNGPHDLVWNPEHSSAKYGWQPQGLSCCRVSVDCVGMGSVSQCDSISSLTKDPQQSVWCP